MDRPDRPEEIRRRLAELDEEIPGQAETLKAATAHLEDLVAEQTALLEELEEIEGEPERRRRGFTVIEGDGLAAVGAVGLARRYPRRLLWAAASTVAAAGVAATALTLSTPSRSTVGEPPTPALSMPAATVTSLPIVARSPASSSPAPPSASPTLTVRAPSAVREPIAFLPPAAPSTVSTSPAPSSPVVSPTAVPSSPPAGSRPPVAPTTTPTVKSTSTCFVDVAVPSLLGVCAL